MASSRSSGASTEATSISRRPAPGIVHAPGDRIAGKYVLESLLGEGGMGSVWHAKSLVLGTDVAIKLILRSLISDEASERLLREARAAARIDHPSVVRVFDFGRSEENEPFIVMELLRGTSLATLFDSRGRLPAAAAVQLLLPIVSALVVAHAQGVVHRDLKPDNVVLVPAPHDCVVPKIVDFGIAKLACETGGRSLTHDGVILGSPEYMSPEQARGAPDVDERTDVWAASVMLYEAITGFRPFEGENYNALLIAIVNEDPVPTTEFAAGDGELWSILQKGLEKPVEKRWQSTQELGVALADWALGRGIDVDVSGCHIDHQWHNSGRISAMLEPLPRRMSSAPAPPGPARIAHTPLVPAPEEEVSLPAAPSRRRAIVVAAAVLFGVGGFIGARLGSQKGGAAAPLSPPSAPATPAVSVPAAPKPASPPILEPAQAQPAAAPSASASSSASSSASQKPSPPSSARTAPPGPTSPTGPATTSVPVAPVTTSAPAASGSRPTPVGMPVPSVPNF